MGRSWSRRWEDWVTPLDRFNWFDPGNCEILASSWIERNAFILIYRKKSCRSTRMGRPPVTRVPDDGYPRNAEHTVKILESTRGDIRQLKALICATTPLAFGARIEYAPTTTAPKSLHCRTFSDKCRTISDIRRINLGVGTGDFFPFGCRG